MYFRGNVSDFFSVLRKAIRECVNASADDVCIFTGNGVTGAVHKLIHALGMHTDEGRAQRTVRKMR